MPLPANRVQASSARKAFAKTLLAAGVIALVVLIVVIGAPHLTALARNWDPFTSNRIRDNNRVISWTVALAVSVFMALLVSRITDEERWFGVVFGVDNRPSTSKCQFFLWTWVTLLCFMALFLSRVIAGSPAPSADLPASLLIAMGVSATTLAAAKGITVMQVSNATIAKPDATQAPTDTDKTRDPTLGMRGLITEDDGSLNLGKIQMLAWTLVALLTFVFRSVVLSGQIARGRSQPESLPDIDSALMVLMGLSHGTYLGKKLVTTDNPRLAGFRSPSGPPSGAIVLKGSSLGDSHGGSMVLVDGRPIPFVGAADVGKESWTDGEVAFRLPPLRSDGAPWSSEKPVSIAVLVGGAESNALPYTVEKSLVTIAATTPQVVRTGDSVKLTGSGFSTFIENVVTIDTIPVAIARSSDGASVSFALPAAHPELGQWTTGQKLRTGVMLKGVPTNGPELTIG